MKTETLPKKTGYNMLYCSLSASRPRLAIISINRE
jgi:hypothetical protein